jgi:hypothetical protein
MKDVKETPCNVEERRDFLRKSAYAAYATPVITALLVDKASAAASGCPCAPRSSEMWRNPGSSEMWQQKVGSVAWPSALPAK